MIKQSRMNETSEGRTLLSGGVVVMGIWGRSADGKKPADAPTRTSGDGSSSSSSSANKYDIDPVALAKKINACHPNVTAWVREVGWWCTSELGLTHGLGKAPSLV